ncbi:VOC family protein [Duganella callida]|uniref:Glyoxalase-like domain protein n=1 Tax=Duganella callida TaxID=2561932 RepID=A0A4Y9SVA6_9BURK|nr:VOC family protein [Duganella callida]TFW30368.1 glyoxalase-like domain protein [Duganella callida]
MVIDHIFIRATPDAPEAAALREFGLTEGSGNRHPGQGTANRRFFFANAFLELLWLTDVAEATSDITAPTHLYERLTQDDTSPFGICFRPSGAGESAAFPCWPYRPAYLPPGMQIDFAEDAPLAEPMWFFFAAAQAPAASGVEPVHHPVGAQNITAVEVTVPQTAPLSAAARASRISFKQGAAHLLAITFDHAMRGLSKDFRPALPLIIRY